MLMRIVRGAGDSLDPDTLTNTLTCAYTPGVEVGRNHLDDVGFNKKIYEMEVPYRGPFLCGDVVEVSDASLGEIFRSRVSGWSVQIQVDTNGLITTSQNITLERSENV